MSYNDITPNQPASQKEPVFMVATGFAQGWSETIWPESSTSQSME